MIFRLVEDKAFSKSFQRKNKKTLDNSKQRHINAESSAQNTMVRRKTSGQNIAK